MKIIIKNGKGVFKSKTLNQITQTLYSKIQFLNKHVNYISLYKNVLVNILSFIFKYISHSNTD